VQAEIDPSRLPEFERWHRDVHLEHVLRIPGITGYRRLRATEPCRYIALYEIADDDAIQPALRSAEAGKAREEWTPWLQHVNNLSVEIYATLAPSPHRRHRN
jgi:hypothetical protein